MDGWNLLRFWDGFVCTSTNWRVDCLLQFFSLRTLYRKLCLSFSSRLELRTLLGIEEILDYSSITVSNLFCLLAFLHCLLLIWFRVGILGSPSIGVFFWLHQDLEPISHESYDKINHTENTGMWTQQARKIWVTLLVGYSLKENGHMIQIVYRLGWLFGCTQVYDRMVYVSWW